MAEPGRPPVSIVVPVHGKALLTRALLERLVAGSETAGAELIVVDDASPDDTRAVVASFGERVRSVELDRNVGFAGACNAGARAASAEGFLLFLNNDVAPAEGWLDALLDDAGANERAAIVGSKLLYPGGSVQHAGVVVCPDRIPRHVYAGFPHDHPAVSRSRAFQIVTGACMLVRRPVFERLGGFDEAFANGFEDVDLCLRAGVAGHEVRYCHASVLEHLESVSRESSPDKDANRRLYLERWGDSVVPDEIQTYLADGLMEIERRLVYPLSLRVSPLLATIDMEGRDELVDRLLDERSRQVFRLLRETIALRLRLAESGEGAASVDA